MFDNTLYTSDFNRFDAEQFNWEKKSEDLAHYYASRFNDWWNPNKYNWRDASWR